MSTQSNVQPQEGIMQQHFLCIALGGNSYLHPYIDESYRKNEWEYYNAFQKSEMRGSPLFSMYSTKSEEKIRQVAGIAAWSRQNGQYSQLYQLIKKGYKFVYQYMQERSFIDFDHFMRSYARRQKGKAVKEIDLLYQNIVLWYLCDMENKPYDTSNIAWISFQKILSASLKEMEIQKSLFSKQVLEQHRKEIDCLYREYKIPKNPCFSSLGELLEDLLSDNIKRIYESQPFISAEAAEQQVFRETPSKFIGALGGWLKTLQIHELDATEQIPFTKTDLDMVFMELLYARKFNYISKSEQDLFFISCLYMKCLGSLYRETKEFYLDQSKQDFYAEMRLKENEVNKKEADLLVRQQEWQFTDRRQQKEIEGLTQELREARAKIRQLEQKIGSLEDYAIEVHALRNFAYKEDVEDSVFEVAPSMESMKEFIQSKRIIIFGGSPGWRQKLKELLPAVEFVDVNEKNRDISRAQRADAVFINTSVFAHSFYKKIMKELTESSTALFYLNGQGNIGRSVLEIYKWLAE